MASFIQLLEEILPQSCNKVLTWEFVPWGFVRERHESLSDPALKALIDAYASIEHRLDLEEIASVIIQEDSWGCLRCGHCCTYMRPGPVTDPTYSRWQEADAPVAWFYQARKRTRKNRVYRCWFHEGIRLRMCPFLIINRNDSRPACSIYHMGDDFRPPVCCGFKPRHETCTSSRQELEPWEST
jgi:hypothetical protein